MFMHLTQNEINQIKLCIAKELGYDYVTPIINRAIDNVFIQINTNKDNNKLKNYENHKYSNILNNISYN